MKVNIENIKVKINGHFNQLIKEAVGDHETSAFVLWLDINRQTIIEIINSEVTNENEM
jgi:hypothetical protein